MHPRNRQIRLVAIVLAAAVGLLAGREVAWRLVLAPLGARPAAPGASTTDARTSDGYDPSLAMVSYLVVGVDDAQRPDAQLEAVWIASLADAGSTAELLGLPVDERLQAAYVASPASLRELLRPRAPGPIAGLIVLDWNNLAAAADELGAVRHGGQQYSGTALRAFLTESSSTRERLLRQAAVVQALVANAAVQDDQLDVDRLLKLVSGSTLDRLELLDAVRPYLPVRTQSIRVRVAPTLEID